MDPSGLDPVQWARRRVLELAWEAYQAGSFPVGALVVDANGKVVAEGRNRIGEADAPPGRLRRCSLAHAEIDALAQLPWGVDYRSHTLYTSLEPCMLCRSAAVAAGIGTVDFLAADPVCDGLDGMATLTAHARRNHPTMVGPSRDGSAHFSAILAMAILVLFSGLDHPTVSECSAVAPDLMDAARRLVADSQWPSRSLSLDEAILALEPFITAL